MVIWTYVKGWYNFANSFFVVCWQGKILMTNYFLIRGELKQLSKFSGHVKFFWDWATSQYLVISTERKKLLRINLKLLCILRGRINQFPNNNTTQPWECLHRDLHSNNLLTNAVQRSREAFRPRSAVVSEFCIIMAQWSEIVRACRCYKMSRKNTSSKNRPLELMNYSELWQSLPYPGLSRRSILNNNASNTYAADQNIPTGKWSYGLLRRTFYLCFRSCLKIFRLKSIKQKREILSFC